MVKNRFGTQLRLSLYYGMAAAATLSLSSGSAMATAIAIGPPGPGPVAAFLAFIAAPIAGPGSCGIGSKDFSSVAACMTKSIENLPGLLTAMAYMFGLLIGSMAIVKMKEHVENPSQTPLRDGAIRFAAGGSLFALPIVFEAMTNTAGNGIGASAASIYRARFNVS